MEHALQVKAKIPNPKDLEGKLGHGAAHHSQVGTNNGKKNVYCQPSDKEFFSDILWTMDKVSRKNCKKKIPSFVFFPFSERTK